MIRNISLQGGVQIILLPEMVERIKLRVCFLGSLKSLCDMGGCQNYGPFLGTLNIRCRILLRTHKGTIILTTTHMALDSSRSLPFESGFRVSWGLRNVIELWAFRGEV